MVTLKLNQVFYHSALNQLSEEWSAGQFVGIIGPNGAGKSTLLKIASGIWQPDAGEVLVNQAPLQRLSFRTRAKHIAYLPQTLSDDIAYTVQQFVEMGRFAYHRSLGSLTEECRKAVHEAMALFNLTELSDTPLAELSGGERQRVAIARSVAQSSQVLLLDEPISNLDLYYQMDILKQLQRLVGQGLLVVMAIHHLELAAQFCTRLVLLSEGRVVSAGEPHEVLTAPNIREVFHTQVQTYADPFHGALRISMTDA